MGEEADAILTVIAVVIYQDDLFYEVGWAFLKHTEETKIKTGGLKRVSFGVGNSHMLVPDLGWRSHQPLLVLWSGDLPVSPHPPTPDSWGRGAVSSTPPGEHLPYSAAGGNGGGGGALRPSPDHGPQQGRPGFIVEGDHHTGGRQVHTPLLPLTPEGRAKIIP